MATSTRGRRPFITRVRLRNYRSIEACDVHLEQLTFLVGINGAGKTNFLDALRLTGDSLRASLGHALRERGGVAEVLRKSHDHPDRFGVRLDFHLHDLPGVFQFVVVARGGGHEIEREDCVWGPSRYAVHRGTVKTPPGAVCPPAATDRLYLVSAAGLPEFRPVFDALSTMGFYNVMPAKIRERRPPDHGDVLDREGANLASVLDRMDGSHPGDRQRIEEYLTRVVPGTEGIEPSQIHGMSDGALRALAVLTALLQRSDRSSPPVVGIEEPTAAIHPVSASLLLDCLREAALDRQVVVTTHSPDLLDSDEIRPEQLLAVASTGGRTMIGAIDMAGRAALRSAQYRAGELLRLDQLTPDPGSISETAPRWADRRAQARR